MKKTLFAALTIVASLIFFGASGAELTTVFLPEIQDGDRQPAAAFTVSADEVPKQTGTLTFNVGPGITGVKRCILRVVATPRSAALRADQDVRVSWGGATNGLWSAYSTANGTTDEPYEAELLPEACVPGTNVLKLETESRHTEWEYYGPTAPNTAHRPRLIVTYDSPAGPLPARSGESTDREYKLPAPLSWFPLLAFTNGAQVRANPVFYDHAIWVVVGSSDAQELCMVTSSNAQKYRLDFTVDAGSFAGVTAWGRLQIITKGAIYSCDLANRGAPGATLSRNANTADKITVDPTETPAMGPDGSLYFKNGEAAGSIVAYNPSLREIWRTDLHFTQASPITLSVDGRYGYVLAEVAVQQTNAAKRFALLRLDTATGETVPVEIEHPKGVKPLLGTLLRPVVARKVSNRRVVDYVFVGANTSDTALLQLIGFEERARPSVVWSRRGKVLAQPVLGVKDGNSLFVLQGGELRSYPWFSTRVGATGAYSDSALKPVKLAAVSRDVTALLVDGTDSVYMYTANSLYVCQNASLSPGHNLELNSQLRFTPDGELIGCNASGVYGLGLKETTMPRE